jgi:hypothetical protein
MHPLRAVISNNTGIAGISLLFSSVFTWANTSRFSAARALTEGYSLLNYPSSGGILGFMWLIILLPFMALACILYFAVSKKSSPTVKRLAVIALILAGVALIVSVLFIVTAPPQEAEPGPVMLPLPVKPVAPVQKVNWQELAVFGLLFILFLLFLFAFSRRNVPSKTENEAAPFQGGPGREAGDGNPRGRLPSTGGRRRS